MLFKRAFLNGVVRGDIDLTFRRWEQPRVRAGTRMRTVVGVIEVVSVDAVPMTRISDRDAIRAGFESRQRLLDEIRRRATGRVYRIGLSLVGDDPRIELRQQSRLTAAEVTAIAERLSRFDAASRDAWTRAALCLIRDHPGCRAGDLAPRIGMELRSFKARIRKLKELGLTESLEVGYRLSPRGRAFVRRDRRHS